MHARSPASKQRAGLRFPLFPVVISFAVTLIGWGGCVLNTHGNGNAGTGGEGGTVTCNNDLQCDDRNPCSADTCGDDKICVHASLPDDKPAPDNAQKAGDCKTIVCQGGQPTDVEEDSDIPDDHEDCTIDGCNATGAYHTGKPDGTVCDVMGFAGACAAGKCEVACKTSSDCPMKDPCTVPSCDGQTGKCVYSNVADGTPTPGVTPAGGPKGDCHVRICIGGMDTNQVDDSDVPVTATDCDTEVCNNGDATNPAKAKDNPCSTYNGSSPGFCDGAGKCQECAKDNECPGVTDDCKHPACVNFACTTAFTPVNTPVTQQMPGDCHVIVCDGAGSTKSNVDDTDLPVDGTVCTNDICTNGVPSHTNQPTTTHCETANSAFTCSSMGQCGCQNNGDCTAPNTCGGGNPGTANVCGCTKTTCAAENTTCGSISDACFSTLNCNDNAKNGTETDVDCGGSGTCAIKCGNGKKCNAGSDCTSGNCVDGVCCNDVCNGTCQACSAAKKGSGSDGTCGAIKAGTDPDMECNDQGAASCGTNGSCDGAGACQLYNNTTTCLAASCADATTVNKAHTCNGTGTCVTPMPSTNACNGYLCSNGVCTTTCANDAQCATGYYCGGGTCLAKKTQGSGCTGTGNQCQSGFCVDGYCCDTACNSLCQACSGALKQSGAMNGTCGAAKDGATDPRGICTMQAASTCGTDGKCSGGMCEDWPTSTQCVAPSCSGSNLTTAKTCDGTGNCNVGGTTAPCPNGFACNGTTGCFASCGTGGGATDTKCASGYYCDGTNGTCKPKGGGGGGCSSNSQCSSGLCLGNICCTASTCPSTSATCAATACAATTGACVYPTSATACGTNVCASASLTTNSCDGTGDCVANSPNACANNLVCANSTSCRTSCGTTDANCVSGYYCDGVTPGACQPKVADGGTCGGNNQCTSNKCGTTGTGNCCKSTATCTTGGTCGATGCSTSGNCSYPAAGTSCGTTSCTGSTLSTSACDGSGMCVPSSAACPNNLLCASATACLTTCGTADPTGDMSCVTGNYCDGAACQAKKATMATCTRDGECVNGTCNMPQSKCN